jgi:hypothetical protein
MILWIITFPFKVIFWAKLPFKLFLYVNQIFLRFGSTLILHQFLVNVLSRAINFGRKYHFKIWLDCHKFKKFPCLIMRMSTKCQKNDN